MVMVILGYLAMVQSPPVPPIETSPRSPAIIAQWVPAPPLPSPPARPSKLHRAVPLRNLMSLIIPEDYPRAAMDGNQQGAVGASLIIGADGRVATCTITESSGWPILDAATCGIFLRRARFRPALDERGAPIRDRASQRVRWELNGIPFAPVTRVTRIVTGPAGAVVSCTGSDDCWATEMSFDEVGKTLLRRPVPVASHIVVERRFEPGERAVDSMSPLAGADGKLSFAAQVRIEVGYNGKVTRCTPLRGGIGNADLLCSLVEPWLFRLGSEKGATRTGVMSLALRARPVGTAAGR